jgi:DNA-binding XRE family transcriptional regulator
MILEYTRGMATLAKKIRQRLGVTQYRMAQLLQRTPRGYRMLENDSKRLLLRDFVVLKIASGMTWEEFGRLITEMVNDENID